MADQKPQVTPERLAQLRAKELEAQRRRAALPGTVTRTIEPSDHLKR